jgi:hypothetical protein
MFSHTWPESFGETLLEAIYIGQAPQRMIILLLLFILFELTQVSSRLRKRGSVSLGACTGCKNRMKL